MMALSDSKILINFQGGAHGNFLEFTLNAAVGLHQDLDPFNFLGASHRFNKPLESIFIADHFIYETKSSGKLKNHSARLWKENKNKIITILIEEDDLPIFISCMYARAGNSQIYFDGLHTDFYNKTKNDRVFEIQKYLTQWSENSELGPNHTDIEKKTLREFLRINLNASTVFLDNQRDFLDTNRVPFVPFKFADFYLPTVEFVTRIKELLSEFGFTDVDDTRVSQLHQKFLAMNKFVGLKDLPLHYFSNLGKNIPIENLSVMQEAYLERLIEKRFGIKMPISPDSFYPNTRDIRKIIEKIAKIW